MRRGQRTFRPDNQEDGYTCYIMIIRHFNEAPAIYVLYHYRLAYLSVCLSLYPILAFNYRKKTSSKLKVDKNLVKIWRAFDSVLNLKNLF